MLKLQDFGKVYADYFRLKPGDDDSYNYNGANNINNNDRAKTLYFDKILTADSTIKRHIGVNYI